MKDYKRQWYLKNRERILNKRKENYIKNKEKHDQIAYERYHSLSMEAKILRRAKDRAREKSIAFDLEVSDIVIPEYCPILNIPLYPSADKSSPNSPSLDRIHNKYGYIKGNIKVISNKANRIKADLTPELCEQLLKYWEINQ